MSDCNTRSWRKSERLSRSAKRYRRSNASGFSRGESVHERRLGSRSHRLVSGKSLTTMSGALAFVTRCRQGRATTLVDAPRFRGGQSASKGSPMAGRPKSRARKSKRAFLQAKYENAGDYIRFKAARTKTYGPVRPDVQPRWLGVQPKRGYRPSGRSSGDLDAIRRQLRKLGIAEHTIKHHLWKLTFYNNADGATSEVDLPGGRIAYILTRPTKSGGWKTRIEKD